MNFFRSIKVRVWARFEIIVLAMLAFTYIFLIAMFPLYYDWMKRYEISETLIEISSNWSADDKTNISKNMQNIVVKQASDKKMFIEIVYEDGTTYIINRLGGSHSLSMLSKDDFIDSVKKSESGLIYKTFRDEQENNFILMLGSYLGGDKNSPDSYIFIFNYLQPIGTTVQIFQSQYYIVGLLIMILTIFMSAFFSNKISEPIIRINNSAKSLSQGKFDVKIGKRDYDEIKQLAGTLSDASKEIAKSDDLRRELMSNISHDLRTPLTMIKAYAEMIRDISGDNPEKREKHLKVIIDETDRLSSLVTDILDLSKLQAGVSELNIETFDLSDNLSEVVSRFEVIRINEGISIELQAEDDIRIYGDVTKLDQVIYNLINNAVTYVGEDNIIIVRLFRIQNGIVRFEVEDHGEGISPENLPYIWDRYYKVSERSSTHKRAKMGSGIGLSIVKSILEQHGFKYGAESSLGKGSKFWFEAPEYSETSPEMPKKHKPDKSDKTQKKQ